MNKNKKKANKREKGWKFRTQQNFRSWRFRESKVRKTKIKSYFVHFTTKKFFFLTNEVALKGKINNVFSVFQPGWLPKFSSLQRPGKLVNFKFFFSQKSSDPKVFFQTLFFYHLYLWRPLETVFQTNPALKKAKVKKKKLEQQIGFKSFIIYY